MDREASGVNLANTALPHGVLGQLGVVAAKALWALRGAPYLCDGTALLATSLLATGMALLQVPTDAG
eukprot:2472997-Lingulodinium_polyedra.AAC.1